MHSSRGTHSGTSWLTVVEQMDQSQAYSLWSLPLLDAYWRRGSWKISADLVRSGLICCLCFCSSRSEQTALLFDLSRTQIFVCRSIQTTVREDVTGNSFFQTAFIRSQRREEIIVKDVCSSSWAAPRFAVSIVVLGPSGSGFLQSCFLWHHAGLARQHFCKGLLGEPANKTHCWLCFRVFLGTFPLRHSGCCVWSVHVTRFS